MLEAIACMLSRVVATAAAAARRLSSATRRIQPLPIDRRSALLAMSQQEQQGNGEAQNGSSGDRRASTSTSTSSDDVRASKKALRSTVMATLKTLSDEEMAWQSKRERERESRTRFVFLFAGALTSNPPHKKNFTNQAPRSPAPSSPLLSGGERTRWACTSRRRDSGRSTRSCS